MKSLLLALTLVGSYAVQARAELVYYTSGRTQSVKGHRVEGDSIVLLPRSGGEMVVDSTVIDQIVPDEVPYPEPQEEAAPDTLGMSARSIVDLPRTDPRYEPIIRRVAAEQGIDATLVRAVIQVESSYQSRARSPKGALGLMQLMPATGRQYGVRNLYDPTANIEAGIKHLKSLLERFPLELALAAYNAGEAAVDRFRGVPPYPETKAYVERILAMLVR